jgi:hypothetical protein
MGGALWWAVFEGGARCQPDLLGDSLRAFRTPFRTTREEVFQLEDGSFQKNVGMRVAGRKRGTPASDPDDGKMKERMLPTEMLRLSTVIDGGRLGNQVSQAIRWLHIRRIERTRGPPAADPDAGKMKDRKLPTEMRRLSTVIDGWRLGNWISPSHSMAAHTWY